MLKQEELYDHINYWNAAKKNDVTLYFFCADDIDLKRRAVKGWVLDDQLGWVLHKATWPDYVYDLAKGNASKERKAKLIRKDKRLSFLNEIRSHYKWHTHNILMDGLAWLLPETDIGGQWQDLQRMLERHTAVLIKPDRGTWGIGISKVWKTGDGSYSLETAEGEMNSGISAKEAFDIAAAYADGRVLLIQQMLELLPIEQSLLDLRLMVGKDRCNQWQVLQSYLSISRPGSFVTNWHQGGSDRDVIPGLIAAGVEKAAAERVFVQAKEAAVNVAAKLEQSYNVRMFEMGLDFAIDTNLRVWLLEANGWPEKGMVEHDQDHIPRVYSCVIDYALYLWNQQHRV